MKWYWFSFSHNGKNRGCCNIEAETQEAALQKTIDLDIHPKHDDIEIYELDNAELEPDKFYSREDMINLNYEAQKKKI